MGSLDLIARGQWKEALLIPGGLATVLFIGVAVYGVVQLVKNRGKAKAREDYSWALGRRV